MKYYFLIGILIIMIIVFYFINSKKETLCVQRNYGFVTDVPVSNYVDANMALVHSTSIGSAPLGNPKYWLPDRSPITQGQYGLYQDGVIPLSETQPFNRDTLLPAAMALPQY